MLLPTLLLVRKAAKLKCTCYCFGAMNAAVFGVRLMLALNTALDKCTPLGGGVKENPVVDYYDDEDYYSSSRDEEILAQESSHEFCLSATDIFFRFVLVMVSGLIIVAYFVALATEDGLLIGMVIGAQV